MAGGTAVALHIGHRRSVDFDLFTQSRLNKSRIRDLLMKIPFDQQPVFEDFDQLHVLINGVKLTFLSYPFLIAHPLDELNVITIPSLLSLAAMKAYALGRRAKWKDYVDLYYILRDFFSIKEISEEAVKIFGRQYSEKLFRQQLSFHKDIDYSESVDYMSGAINENEIREFLIDKSTDLF
jgi:hypothetical protein